MTNNGKLYYVKDSQKKRNETSDDNKLVVDDYKKSKEGKRLTKRKTSNYEMRPSSYLV